jgi:chemotaxis response regulator CheB
VQHQTNVSNTLEKLKENMEEQTEIISSNNMKLTNIELEKKQKLENERNCRDEQEQIEAQIKQLQREKRKKSELERSLNGDIDRLSQKHRDVQYLISQSTHKKNELSKRYEDELGKEKEFSQTSFPCSTHRRDNILVFTVVIAIWPLSMFRLIWKIFTPWIDL